MADRGPLNVNVKLDATHHKGEGWENSSSTTSSADFNSLSARLSKNEADTAKLMAVIGDLSVGLKNVPTAMEAIAVAATRMAAGNKTETSADVAEKSRNLRYSEQANKAVGKVDALQRTWGSDLSPEQSKILNLRNEVNSHIDAAGNFTSNTKEATQSLSQLNQSLKNINKTVGSSAGSSGGMNAFNVAEALTYATILSAGKYANIGATYDIGIQGASANQLGMMTVQRDIAQRNAVSSGVMSGGAAIGAVIGGMVGGLPGGIIGSAIGASLGVISSGITASMNAHQLQDLTMQQLGNYATMYGGQGGNTLTTPKANGWDIAKYSYLHPFTSFAKQVGNNFGLNYDINNPDIANDLNQGKGYEAITSASLQAAGSIYGLRGSKLDTLKTIISAKAASTNTDFSPYASSLSYLASVSSGDSFAYKDFPKILNSAGGNPGGLLNNIQTLVQRTSMGVGSATNYASSLQPYGQAYASAGMGLQTMGVAQNLQMAAMLPVFTHNLTLQQLKNNPRLLQSHLKNMGEISIGGYHGAISELMAQNTPLGVTGEQGIMHARALQGQSSVDTSPSALSTPTAVQTGINATGGGKTTASHVTIQAQTVHVIGQGQLQPQPMTASHVAETQKLMRDLNGLTQGVG